MLKNMTIGRKLAVGFGLVLILLTLVGVLSFRGVSQMGAGAHDVIGKNELTADLARKEIDHLNWANQVVALITDESVTELSVETDDHKCAFGQWLYSEHRERAEKEIPALASILKQIEVPHRHLHESAIEIARVYQPADAELPGLIAARMVDHLKWADVLRDAFLENKTSVDVQTDPTQCALGKWLDSEKAHNAYASGSAELKRAWDEMLVVHKHLHESAVDVCKHLSEGEQGHVEAKKAFDEKTVPALQKTLQHLETIKTSADQAVAGTHQAGQVFATQTKPCLHQVQTLLGQATRQVDDVVAETNKGMLASAQLTKLSVTILSSVAIALGIAAAVFIARGIISALKVIIESLNEGSEQVAAASGQVSAASQSLAEGATEQAAGLEETSSSLEEMSSMTRQNADNAQQANTLASEARKAANTGAESMGKMNAAIREIQRSSDETAKIIKVIDEIAFQTNLLALNAAVEAARAGEAGKGFAVVAEEVRNLAMRSAEAAKNTAGMIEESVKNARNGVDIASEVGAVLGQIVEGVSKTTDLVSEIAAASQEQAQGIDQVNTAVAQMDKVTQQNAANAEESASASEELSAQAESMKEIVGQLVALVGGRSSGTSDSDGYRTSRQGSVSKPRRAVAPGRNFAKADAIYHRIAAGPKKAVNSVGHGIPLDDEDGDFREFNG